MQIFVIHDPETDDAAAFPDDAMGRRQATRWLRDLYERRMPELFEGPDPLAELEDEGVITVMSAIDFHDA